MKSIEPSNTPVDDRQDREVALTMQDEAVIIPTVCAAHCIVCEGMEHHWLPESDDEINEGEPFMQCKHCNAVRELEDDEEWD